MRYTLAAPTSMADPSNGSLRSSGPVNRSLDSTTCMPKDFHSRVTLGPASSSGAEAVAGLMGGDTGLTGDAGVEGTGLVDLLPCVSTKVKRKSRCG